MSNEEIQTLRSNFLIHWTGNDIDKKLLFSVGSESLGDLDNNIVSDMLKQEFANNMITLSQNVDVSVEDAGNRWQINDGQKVYIIRKEGNQLNIYDKKFKENITDCEKRERHEKYVDRLFETIIENETIENKIKANNDDKKIRGLWVNHQPIEVKTDDSREIKFEWPSLCFTEIKLSDTIKHAKRYGFLGFGFTREFVMDKSGAPVLYVKGEKEKGKDIIQANFYNLYNGLERMKNESSCNYNYKAIEHLLSALISCLIFVKRMSDSNTHKFELLDESEWRVPCDTNKTYMDEVFGFQVFRNNEDKPLKPAFVFPFCQEQLKVLVFPDEKTRILALGEKDERSRSIVKWLFQDKTQLPIIATVDECMQF